MLKRLAAVLGIAALFCAGCQRAEKRADLVFLNGAEPETLDPPLIVGQPDGRVVNALFEGLTTFDSKGLPGPGMAESWTISDDKKTYTFKIRPEAKWSNGRKLTARDFVESWKRTLTPETAASYSYQLYSVKNGQAFAEGKIKDFSEVGVKALDDDTLQVTLENPTPYFLALCATPPLQPVPIEIVSKYGDSWIKPATIVNNGAYLLDTWRINDRILLRKNPAYWNAGNVALETIEVLPIEKDTVAFNFYASGIADLAMDKGLTPPALLDDLKKRPDFHAAPFLGIYFLRFNCSKAPFNDVRVRKAFSMSVDKKRIVEKITRAGELPATAFVPPGLPGYESPQALPYDPGAARKLLAEAGFPDGKGFPLVTYLYDAKGSSEAIAVELQDMWRKELGIDVNLARQEWKVYLNSMSSLDFDICRSSWVGDYPDPNTFLDMFVTGGGNNRTGFSDPAYDRLIADAAREPDVRKRAAIFRQAETMLIDTEAPICPVYFYVGVQLYDPDKIGGIEPNVLDEHPLKAIYRKDR